MCLLVTVMCVSLVLLETGAVAGLVLPQTICRDQCVLQCQQLDDAHARTSLCCDCQFLCNELCRISLKRNSALSNSMNSNLLELDSSILFESPKTACTNDACKGTENAPRRLRHPCGFCRTKRRLRSPTLREAALIAQSVGLDLSVLDAEILGEEVPANGDSITQVQMIQLSWNLRLVSLSAGVDVVTAQVTWDPQPGGSWYLVTWEVEGGSLRGNLLTNTTSPSLTLWPDMIYHVQISAASTGDKSECMMVDLESRPPPSQPLHILAGGEGVAGAVVAVFVFLLVLLLAKRWRNRSRSPSKDVDELPYCNKFKLYPPPITLCV